MIKISVTGCKEAEAKIRSFADDLIRNTVDGLQEAGFMLIDRIQREYPEYEVVRYLDMQIDYSKARVLIAPEPEYLAEAREKTNAVYMWRYHKCPYYKYMKRPKVMPKIPDIVSVVLSSLSEIKAIVRRNIEGS